MGLERTLLQGVVCQDLLSRCRHCQNVYKANFVDVKLMAFFIVLRIVRGV